MISIHALRGEGDVDLRACAACGVISIHALRGEGDAVPARCYAVVHREISIHALRGEGDDIMLDISARALPFQSTPSVGRATKKSAPAVKPSEISIHALRGEGDALSCAFVPVVFDISIHALRGEGDSPFDRAKRRQQDFNPRPPWGGRLPSI